MHLFVYEVQFGARPDYVLHTVGAEGEKYANKRAEIYGALRAWMKTGCLPNESTLRQQLLSITYTYNVRDQIILTSKEQMMRDGKDSPDDVDALATTFALPLNRHANAGGDEPHEPLVQFEYNPFDDKRMAA
jgi:hypothetical protein